MDALRFACMSLVISPACAGGLFEPDESAGGSEATVATVELTDGGSDGLACCLDCRDDQDAAGYLFEPEQPVANRTMEGLIGHQPDPEYWSRRTMRQIRMLFFVAFAYMAVVGMAYYRWGGSARRRHIEKSVLGIAACIAALWFVSWMVRSAL